MISELTYENQTCKQSATLQAALQQHQGVGTLTSSSESVVRDSPYIHIPDN